LGSDLIPGKATPQLCSVTTSRGRPLKGPSEQFLSISAHAAFFSNSSVRFCAAEDVRGYLVDWGDVDEGDPRYSGDLQKAWQELMKRPLETAALVPKETW